MCSDCGRTDVKVWPDGRCSFCGINRQKGLNVVGLDYAVQGRMDRMKAQKDTLRAIEMMANNPNSTMTRAEATRWAATARQMDDRSYKMDPDGAGEPADRTVPLSPSDQAAERKAEGHITHLWSECKHDHHVQRGKPVNNIQAENFKMVERAGEA